MTGLKEHGYTTLMAGDGTNDVGALKQAHIGVALLDGTPEDLQKIAERNRIERMKAMYEQQKNLSARFNAPVPPPPPAIAHLYPEFAANRAQLEQNLTPQQRRQQEGKKKMENMANKLLENMDMEEAPTIKFGDASVAAPFTSKLRNVVAGKLKKQVKKRWCVCDLSLTDFLSKSEQHHSSRPMHSGGYNSNV